MSSPFQGRRAEEKLGLILGRISSIRVRLNSLAWQRAAFGVLAWMIAAGTLVMVAAFYLGPLVFLGAAVILALALAAGLFHTIRGAWSIHVNPQTAASIADRRADLKGRLETIVQIGGAQQAVKPGSPGGHPVLWPYLIEDTLAHQDEFEPRRIERRRISRSVYPFMGSLVLAALALPLIARMHGKPIPAAADQMDMTLNLNDLQLRPADPGSDSGQEVHADAQTMRRLQEKMASEAGNANDGASSPLDHLMNHARNLAGNLQKKLTGRDRTPPRINLKLADASDHLNPPDSRNGLSKPNPAQKPDNETGHFERDDENPAPDRSLPKPRHRTNNSNQQPQSSGQAPSSNGSEAERTDNNGKDQSADSADQANNDQSGSGSSHGIGAAPDSLFGPPVDPKLGSQGFEISIEARPMSTGAKGAGHGYLPPKVKAPLNASQQPDEPIARASVPEEDRAAIKRVFER